MVWGYMAWSEPGSRVQVSGRMDTQQYISIPAEKLIPDMETICLLSHMPPINQYVCQQNTDSKHTTRATEKLRRFKNMSYLNWPARWPDFNPIVHLWG